MIHAREDYNRIQDTDPNGIYNDEPVFLLRAKDKLFIPMLQLYSFLYCFVATDVNISRMYGAINNHIKLAEEWQRRNADKVRVADIPPEEKYKQGDRVVFEIEEEFRDRVDCGNGLQSGIILSVMTKGVKEKTYLVERDAGGCFYAVEREGKLIAGDRLCQ